MYVDHNEHFATNTDAYLRILKTLVGSGEKGARPPKMENEKTYQNARISRGVQIT